MDYTQNDIVQITDETHPWFPALLVVDEVKSWGVQAFAFVIQSNDGSKPVARAYNRIEFSSIEKVGSVAIGVAS